MNKVYVVGIGPGSIEDMTLRAINAIKACDVVAGYEVYVELIKPIFPEKEYIITPMRHETERCRMAIEAALAGRSVCMISSGDAGVYGMAGLMLEMALGKDVTVEVIPGVTAALSGSALLGAPLGHDFAVISLSDLLTPWEKIEARLSAAAKSDMCIAIYNPSSKKRADHLKRACEIILRYQSPDTVCGVARNISREGEECSLTTLGELKNAQTDMFTTVFIGNSLTRAIDGKMVTPRGYAIEQAAKER